MQIGIVVDLARGHRISVPLNEGLVAMVHELEDGDRPMTLDNLEELRRLNAERYFEHRDKR